MSAKKGFVILLIAILIAPALAIHSPVAAQGGNPPRGLRPDAPTYAVRGPYWVGTRQFTIETDSEKPLLVLAWYPALNPDGAEESVTYPIQVKWEPAPDCPTEVYGHALSDAAPDASGAPYPVLVLSPGFGANAAVYSNVVENLVSYGFVVLAPEHQEGVYLADDDPFRDAPMTTIERPRDIRRTLDYAEALTATGGEFEGLIDMDNVAVAGHSSGGYTALATAGARVDFDAFHQRCETARAEGDPNAWLCDDLEPHGADMAAMAGLDSVPAGLWPSWGDARVDAAIPMAGDSYLFDQAGLAEITVPILVMGGTADSGTPFDWGAGPTFEYVSSPEKVLVAFENAEHALFTNGCEATPWLVDIGFSWMCLDPVWDKQRTNDLASHFVTAFLLAVLKGDDEARAALAPDAAQFPGITYESAGF
jgi:predicted dienelactone hydrolase